MPTLPKPDNSLIQTFAPHFAKGIYRDPMRSSHSHFVKASGLRWISLMLLAPIPWAGVIMQLRRWLLARKMVTLAPAASAGVVADSEFAAILWLFRLTQVPGELCVIVRLRLDAALYQSAPARNPGAKGRPR